jgi:hypothetical protein
MTYERYVQSCQEAFDRLTGSKIVVCETCRNPRLRLMEPVEVEIQGWSPISDGTLLSATSASIQTSAGAFEVLQHWNDTGPREGDILCDSWRGQGASWHDELNDQVVFHLLRQSRGGV